ncbi:MAG: TolC family protein, partial [Steroidobacteraceae bacterium]
GAAAEPLSFAGALERLQETPAEHAAQARWAEAQSKVHSARSLGLPTVELAAQYAHLDSPIEVDLSPLNDLLRLLFPGATPIPNPILQEDRFGIAEVTVRWPIFAGGRIGAARAAASLGASAAHWARTTADDALFLELVTRYYAVSVAQRAVEVQEALLSGLGQHDRNARALYDNDQISHVERLVSAVALAQGEQSALNRRHTLALARSALATLLSLPDAPDPVTELTVPKLDSQLNTLHSDAEATNPLLRQLVEVRAQAEQGVKAAKGEYLPTVALFGAYKLDSYQLPELLPRWVAGVSISVPVFDGGLRRSHLDEARAKLAQASALNHKAVDELRLLVEQRYLAYQDALARIKVSERTVTLTEERLRAERAAFGEGVGRSVDVIDAENAAAGAKLAQLAARYDAAVDYATLMLAAGHRKEAENHFRNQPVRGSTP